jgi:hypothetical protein
MLVALGASATANAATATVTDLKDGFSFVLPAKWVEVPLNGSDISALLAQATKKDPSLENAIDAQVKNAAKQGIRVFAIGPVSRNFSPNLNIGVESSAGAPTGAAFFSAADAEEKLQLAQSGLTNVRTHDATLRFTKVLEVSYALPKSLAGVASSGLQVVFEHTTHVYFLTITSLSAATNKETLKSIASNWRWR